MIGISLGISLRSTTVSSAPVVSNIYYVDPAGSDANDGKSTGAAWQTLAKVNAATIPAGSMVLFKGGATFTGQLTLVKGQHFYASGGTVLYGSYSTGKATITAGVVTDHGVLGLDAQNVNLSDLICSGSGTMTSTSMGVKFTAEVAGVRNPGVVIQRCEFYGYGYDGISLRCGDALYSPGTSLAGWDSPIIQDNIVHDCTGNAIDGLGNGIAVMGVPGIQLLGAASSLNVIVRRNTVYNIIGKVTTTNCGSGILVGNANGVTIENNLVYDCGASGTGSLAIWIWDTINYTIQFNEVARQKTSGTTDGSGVGVDGGCQNGFVQYNYAHDCDGNGLQMYAYSDGAAASLPLQNNVFRYNISENNGNKNKNVCGGASIGSNDSRTANNNWMYGNTIYMYVTGGTGLVLSNIVKYTNSGYLNNIVYCHGPSSRLIYDATSSAVPATFKALGNLYYTQGVSPTIKWGSTTYTSLNAWRAGSGAETVGAVDTSVVGDPLFSGGYPIGNIGGFNSALLVAYQTQGTSIARGNGIDITTLGLTAPTRDLFNNTAPQGPYDIGAYEGTGSNPPPLSIMGTAPAGNVGTAYSFQPSASGGSGTKTYSSSGTLPAGTSLNTSTGLVSGTLTTAGSYTFNISVTDGTGTASLGSQTVVVGAALATFSDTFTRADENLEANANWTKLAGATAGAAKVVSGALAATSTVENVYVSPDLLTQDQFVQFKVAGLGSSGPFMLVKVSDINNWVGIRFSTSVYQLFKRVGGTLTQVGTITGTPVVGDVVKLLVAGTTYTVFVNGVQNAQMTITDAAASTRQGIITRTAVRTPFIDDYLASAQ